jgi:hypothetical protein
MVISDLVKGQNVDDHRLRDVRHVVDHSAGRDRLCDRDVTRFPSAVTFEQQSDRQNLVRVDVVMVVE